MANARAVYEITALDKTKRVFSKITRRMRQMGRGARSAGMKVSLVGTALALMGVKAAKSVDQLAKMAKRTKTSVRFMAEMQHATQLTGSSFEHLGKGLVRMASTLEDATGDDLMAARRTFQKLGLDMGKLQKMDMEDRFLKIGEALAKMDDQGDAIALSREVFGRAGETLLPLFQEGPKALKAMRAEAHDLGIVPTESEAKRMEDFIDAMTKLGAVFRSIGVEIAEAILPILERIVDKIKEAGGIVPAFKKMISGPESPLNTQAAAATANVKQRVSGHQAAGNIGKTFQRNAALGSAVSLGGGGKIGAWIQSLIGRVLEGGSQRAIANAQTRQDIAGTVTNNASGRTQTLAANKANAPTVSILKSIDGGIKTLVTTGVGGTAQ